MSYSNPRSFFFAGLGVLGVGMLVAACGSSNGSPGDAGGDISHKPGCGVIICNVDAGDDGSASGGFAGDGTTGKPCQKDSDCLGPGGAGVTLCSNNPAFTLPVSNVQVNLLPTPICLIPPVAGGNCDPAPPSDPSGQNLYQCDGPNSICMPFDPSNPQSGQGLCQAACTAALDGTQATGCPGKDTCAGVYAFPGSATAAPLALGFCQGACEKDSDCADLNSAQAGADAGPPWVCQTDIGFCTQRLRTRTKQIGAACISPPGRNNDNTTGACYCPLGNSLNQGFCTQACIVGGTVPCPNGWLCDDFQPAMLSDGTPVTKENINSPGFCVPACSLDGGTSTPMPEAAAPEASAPSDASSDASDDGESGASTPIDASGSPAEASTPADAGTLSPGACPPNSTCQSTTVLGPECSP